MEIVVKIMLLLGISLLGIPAGILISKYTEDEIKTGKKWIKMALCLSVLLLILNLLMVKDFETKASVMTISGFLFFLLSTSLRKG